MARRNAIVFAADARLFPAAVFQAARLNALGGRDDTDIVIATDSAADIERATRGSTKFRPWLIPPGAIPDVRMYGKRLPASTYYRIFLPAMLNGEYRRLLYLDVDIFIHSDRIFRLLDLAMEGNAIGAVRDPLPYRGIERELAEMHRTITNREQKYLNAGVLLIDPDRFVAERLEKKILEVAARQPLALNDQSAINIVLDGEWLELSPAFNMLVEFWPTFLPLVCDPVIVHFIGFTKPWHGPRFRENHPVRAAMEEFFPTSPWPGFLSGFYGLKEAMADLQNRNAPVPRPPEPPFEPAKSEAYLDFLRSTRFADVAAGLTTLRLDAIPGRP